MQVTLYRWTERPLEVLYVAYRTDYSAKTPQQIAAQIAPSGLSDRQRDYITARLAVTSHTSPLEQVSWTFLVSGISRALSHQLVRTRAGFSPEQQSQRYVKYDKRSFPFVTPPAVAATGEAQETLTFAMAEADAAYARLLELGIAAEDARFLLPNATQTNLTLTINHAALLHLCDLRLCSRAQWEYRALASQLRRRVMEVEPLLGAMLGPKCLRQRAAVCDESLADWQACPLGRVRPHKSQVEQLIPLIPAARGRR